jgi:hypothetical protein
MRKASGFGARPDEAVLLALLAFVPVVFLRGTADVFEGPKVALLCTGALLLAAWWIAGELAIFARAGATAWLAGAARRAGSGLRRDPLGAAILLYLASAAASTFASANPALSFFGAPERDAGLRTALATAAAYFASRSLDGTSVGFHRLATASALGAAVAAGYALLQLLNLDPLTWGRTDVLGGALRVFGTLAHSNFLGAYLAMVLILVPHGVRHARGGAARIGWLALAAGGLVALVATLSRAAWIAFVGAIAVWALLDRLVRRPGKAAPAAPPRRPAPPRLHDCAAAAPPWRLRPFR